MKRVLSILLVTIAGASTCLAQPDPIIESITKRDQEPVARHDIIPTDLNYQVITYFPDEPPVVPHPGVDPIIYETTTIIEPATVNAPTRSTNEK